ncbi:hypothetical protein EI94DRAFT_1834798 [Lactarius quietus]|nr:hypothetical protein EI94DRAFT_1834798 [Lactarius quietus]
MSRRFAVAAAEEYREELPLRPLIDGKLSSHFSFSTELPGSDGASLHAIPEFHLTINSGKWNYDRWGNPSGLGVVSGDELWAWMGDGAVAHTIVNTRWKALQKRVLGAILRLTLQDGRAREDLSHALISTHQRSRAPRLHPTPHDAPCGTIVALLEPHRTFNADWHGLGAHVRSRADAGVDLRLTVQAVLDPVRTWTDRGWYVMVFKPGAIELERVCVQRDELSLQGTWDM